MNMVRQLRLGVLVGILLSALLAWGLSWQALVIQKQRVLIRVLQQDSTELFNRKMQEQRELQLKRKVEQLRSTPQPGAAPGCLPHQICG